MEKENKKDMPTNIGLVFDVGRRFERVEDEIGVLHGRINEVVMELNKIILSFKNREVEQEEAEPPVPTPPPAPEPPKKRGILRLG